SRCRRPGGSARGGAVGVKLRWAEPLVGRLGAALVGLLAATWRYRVRGWEHVAKAHRLQRPIVYVLWHSRILPLLYSRRLDGLALLISPPASRRPRHRGRRARVVRVVAPLLGPLLPPQAVRDHRGRL